MTRPRPLVFLFPGQSSRDPQMFDRLAAIAPAEASRALEELASLAGRPFGELASNLEVQLAVFLATRVYARLAHRHGLRSSDSAGMSLGEYSHLVEIDALDESSSVELVRARGRAYDDGPSGVMLAVHPVREEEIHALVNEVREELGGGAELLAVSSYNSPTQVVVAGREDAVERLAALAEHELCAQTSRIERRIPMHTPRFAPVASGFRKHLEQARFRPAAGCYWPNVDGAPLASARPSDIVERLSRHVYEPVQWRRTVDALVGRYRDAVFVEVGPRTVLTNLMKSRWQRKTPCFSLDLMDETSPASFEVRVEEIHRARQ